MSQSPEQVVRGMYEAFARAEIEAILDTLDEQVDWRSPENLPHGGHFVGRENVGRFFQGIGQHWETLAVEVQDVISAGDRVVVLLSARGRLRASGEDTGYTAAHAWKLRDGTPVQFAETVDAPVTLPPAVAAT